MAHHLHNDTNSFSAHPHTSPLISALPVSVLLLLCILLGFEGSVLHRSHMCYSNPAAVARLNSTACVCLLRTAAEFVCGQLSERPARCDERHLDLPIHFTFAPINYSTGQPIKNEGERSGPRPPKAATRQLSP